MTAPVPAARGKSNRLLHESSPYLQQHAYNPVDWYPWGEEALQAARTLDRPIFLSIGYSACHWCHVMEHESFENPTIAAAMNDHFINIKVDREERPDLDQIYMNAVQIMTRHGGWPMSVFLTPDLKPFFGGTYWPPVAGRGMPGFHDILSKVHDTWIQRRDDVLRGAEELTEAVREIARADGDRIALTDEPIRKAAQQLVSATDWRHGGFGRAPKFPHATDIRLLMHAWKRFGEEKFLSSAILTLDCMARGGIYDHLGGGFSRYSTDERWLVPHFEKMLYDNALLVPAYLEAYQITGNPFYARVVRETLDYILREMTQPEGGFYSTQDADSEGVEGKFFVWTLEEITTLLGEADARVLCACYDVTPHGNWEEQTILNRRQTDEQDAEALKMSVDALREILERCRQKMFDRRKERIPPGRDDKVLTSWNGMMISSMAQAAQVLDAPAYAQAARSAADFILQNMRTTDGLLLHGYKDGKARFNAYLDDYACLIDGLVDLYQAVFEPAYLETAAILAEQMQTLFQDVENGGFYYTASNHEELIARNKESHDGSTPSGNSMAATVLLRLGRISGRGELEEAGVRTLDFLSAVMAQSAMAAGQGLLALDFLLGPTRELAIIDGKETSETAAVLSALHRRFVPNKVVVRRSATMVETEFPAILQPLLKGKTSRGGATTIFICEHGACGLPVVGVAGLEAALSR